MKKLITAISLALSLLLATPTLAQDLQKGFDAVQRGDYTTAFKEWKPLAEQGDVVAQYNLGLMYDNGDGIPQNYKEAVKWYRLAAEQGYAAAQYNLGIVYANGRSVPQDFKEAVKWWRKAAVQGDASAQNNLGVSYAEGQGILRDYIAAHVWLNIATSNGAGDAALKNRDEAAKQLSPSDLEFAQDLARKCFESNYTDCP